MEHRSARVEGVPMTRTLGLIARSALFALVMPGLGRVWVPWPAVAVICPGQHW